MAAVPAPPIPVSLYFLEPGAHVTKTYIEHKAGKDVVMVMATNFCASTFFVKYSYQHSGPEKLLRIL